jgi:hypothetical protein
LTGARSIRACQGWRWTILPSLVSALVLLPRIISLPVPAATSVDVECTFSKGCILLSHLRNRLSVESTRALICLGTWSSLGYVRDSDMKAETLRPVIDEEETINELESGWDDILY